jgi:hypothetical protein
VTDEQIVDYVRRVGRGGITTIQIAQAIGMSKSGLENKLDGITALKKFKDGRINRWTIK